MARQQAQTKKRPTGRRAARDPGPSDYALEALTEWGNAFRYGAAALTPIAGRAANAVVARLGVPGKLAAKANIGERIVKRLRPSTEAGGHEAEQDGHDFGSIPTPIQESITVALPLAATYALATNFDRYPDFLDRVVYADPEGDTRATFGVKARGARRTVQVELVDVVPRARVEWRSSGELTYAGAASFHQLAPRLTHVELSLEPLDEGPVQRLARRTHLTDHAVRAELHRFKAYAELWQEDEDPDDVEDEPAGQTAEDEDSDEDRDQPEDGDLVDEDGDADEGEDASGEEFEDQYEEKPHAYSDAIAEYESVPAYGD